MKNLLFIALFLGSFLAIHCRGYGQFEFYDERGNCWRCTPGSSCVRCNPLIPRNGPIDWPNQCVTPDCEQLRAQNIPLSVLIPSRESKLFYQCRPDPANSQRWIAIERECPCDTLFSFENQRCDWPHDWIPHCTNLNIPVQVEPCPGGTEPSEVPIETTTTLPLTTTTELPITTIEFTTTKTELTTTKVDTTTPGGTGGPDPDTQPTTTPGATGGPDPDQLPTTTSRPGAGPGPCVCIPWWPCACNPCWMMPCGRCGGCGMMMG